jgi:hypothetical protein
MINTIPVNDEREHRRGQDCWCQPRVEWCNEETGEVYPNGPLGLHNSADHREAVERLLGEPLAQDKRWAIYED